MARGHYPRELSKTDPLVTEHIKIPTSAIATLTSMAAKAQRDRTWIIREILMEAALKYRKEQGRKS
jgi:Ribbon-helix-helix protein, copG family